MESQSRIISNIKRNICIENLDRINNAIAELKYYDLIEILIKNHNKTLEEIHIPLLWKSTDPCYEGKSYTWLLLEEVYLEDNDLFIGVVNYHSGPPDYHGYELKDVPINVLENLLQIINNI